MRRLFPLLFLVSACAEPPLSEIVDPSYEQLAVATGARLQAVSVIDGRTVWASGTNGTYVRSTNGGKSFTIGVVPGADSLEFRDIHAFDANRAFLLSSGSGSNSRIFRTSDAGSSWMQVFTNSVPGAFFDCFDFWDSERGIVMSDAVDGDFHVLTTSDGGDSWQRVPPERLPDARPGEGGFAASGTCLVTQPRGRVWFGTGASGIDTRVFHSADYGASWTASVTPIPSTSSSSGIFSVAFRDSVNGLIFGGDYTRTDSAYGHTARTSDGGATWTLAGDTRLRGAVYGAVYVPGQPTPTLLAVSPTGASWSKSEGARWYRIDELPYWAVDSADDGHAFVVGPRGRVGLLVADAMAGL